MYTFRNWTCHEKTKGKSPGLDGIPAELVKATDPAGIKMLHKLCISIWKSCHWPEDWKIQEFMVLFKAGDHKLCSNYRTIALISHTSKILLLIIVDPTKEEARAWTTRRASCVQERQRYKGYVGMSTSSDGKDNCCWTRGLYHVIIDYSKAFDSVSHCKLLEAFLEMGFPKHLVALLRSLYVNQRATIRWNGDHTQEFQISRGARQGCILSPHLFVTYTEKGMRDAEVSKYGVNVGGKLISNLRYADDTALLANSKDEITQLTNSVNDAGKELNLRLNVKKTKIMVAGAVPEEHNIMIDGENVEQVDRFKYLGSTKTANANCSNDIKSRIAIAKKRMIDLQVIWNDTNLSIQLKMKLVKTLVWSALVYGAESWTLFKADVNRIMAAEMWFWRRMLNINWKQKRTNASVLLELGTERQLLGKVISLKMGYFGHTVRGSGSPLALDIIEGKVEGKRKPGRQKKKWFDNIKEWTGLNYVQAKRAAQDRQKWRKITKKSAEVVANRQKWRRQQGNKVTRSYHKFIIHKLRFQMLDNLQLILQLIKVKVTLPLIILVTWECVCVCGASRYRRKHYCVNGLNCTL